MADVEMIFPDKHVGIKPFQLVNLMVTVITALVTGVLVLWKVRVRLCGVVWRWSWLQQRQQRPQQQQPWWSFLDARAPTAAHNRRPAADCAASAWRVRVHQSLATHTSPAVEHRLATRST
jgi:hypothetical protein